MSDARIRSYVSLVLFLAVMIALGVWVSCGGNSSTTSKGTGTVTTSLSDPPTCAAPNGSYKNVYVTITKVTANINSSAGPSDSGWQTLVDLTKAPMQIDLLSLESTTCLLKQLGSTTGLPPGNYQQIRVYLLDNSPAAGTAVPSSNNCGGASGPFNCVVTDTGTSPLLLSSESQTGIKIPPGQIGGGGINLAAGQSADINILFQTCDSIVRQGNGGYRLKPTLRADEVALNSNSIGGTVVVGDATGQPVTPLTPIPGAVVLLEQPDPNNANVDRVVESDLSASDGTFFFCPLPAGTYDVVVAASVTSGGTTTTYNATVTLAVPLGSGLGNIPLVPETAVTGVTGTPPGVISGLIQTTGSSATVGTTADISLSALQPVGGTSSLLVTVPAFSGSTSTVTTDSPLPTTTGATTCGTTPAGSTGCVTYTLNVPASNPAVGTFASGGTTYTPPVALPAIFWVNAQAFVPMSATSNAGQPDCSSPSLPTSFSSGTGGNNLSISGAAGTATQDFTFTGCQ